MFSQSSGIGEIVCLLFVLALIAGSGVFKPVAWRWVPPIGAILLLSMICTPADPVSMILVAIPMCSLFAVGVYMSGYLTGKSNGVADK